jgi:hypothetical protein
VRPVWIVVGGIGIGLLAVLGIAAVVWGDSGPATDAASREIELTFPAVEHDESAAESLVVAWNRWRTSTFVSSGTWTRTLDGSDSPLSGDVYVAQDPPRRLVVRLGSVTEQIDGTLTVCDGSGDEIIVPGCGEVTTSRSYDDRVRSEMSLILRYVIGDARIYDVARVDNCFQVELLPAALRSPWGRAAEFCFDDESGALRSSRVRRQSAVDVETTTVIRTEVTEADF